MAELDKGEDVTTVHFTKETRVAPLAEVLYRIASEQPGRRVIFEEDREHNLLLGISSHDFGSDVQVVPQMNAGPADWHLEQFSRIQIRPTDWGGPVPVPMPPDIERRRDNAVSGTAEAIIRFSQMIENSTS